MPVRFSENRSMSAWTEALIDKVPGTTSLTLHDLA
jgi:hypothetical protein